MRALDKFEQIANDAAYATVILGNVETQDFELVDLSSVPLRDNTALKFSMRGFEFLGILGIMRNGKPKSALVDVLDEQMSDRIVAAFTKRLEAGFIELERLFGLNDSRLPN